jgi:hypothetical protein
LRPAAAPAPPAPPARTTCAPRPHHPTPPPHLPTTPPPHLPTSPPPRAPCAAPPAPARPATGSERVQGWKLFRTASPERHVPRRLPEDLELHAATRETLSAEEAPSRPRPSCPPRPPHLPAQPPPRHLPTSPYATRHAACPEPACPEPACPARPARNKSMCESCSAPPAHSLHPGIATQACTPLHKSCQVSGTSSP